MKNSGRTLPPAREGPLLEWLVQVMQPMPKTRVKQLLKFGQIAVNGTATTQFDYPLRTGDRVTVGIRGPNTALATQLAEAGIPLRYADRQLLIVDKPAGLLSVATEGDKEHTAVAVLNACLACQRAGRAFVVHRLDRGTSGLLIFARHEDVRTRLQASWDTVRKTYLAVVEGCPTPSEGVVRNYLTEGNDYRVRASDAQKPQAKYAESHYRVRAHSVDYALVEVDLTTGRKHQIRVHLAELGCPVVGDSTYGATTNPLGRMGLHAWRLALPHPEHHTLLEVEAPVPTSFSKVVERH